MLEEGRRRDDLDAAPVLEGQQVAAIVGDDKLRAALEGASKDGIVLGIGRHHEHLVVAGDHVGDVAKGIDGLTDDRVAVRGEFLGVWTAEDVVDLVPSDLDDNKVVACALEAPADYIVTDDHRDLLPLKAIRLAGHKVIQIVRPMLFLRDSTKAPRSRSTGRDRG